MRETSYGLGVMQVVFTMFFVAVLIWLAVGFAAAALVIWAIIHVATTFRSPAAAPALPTMSAAAAASTPAGSVPVQVAESQRERTNWAGVVGALLVASAAIPFLLNSSAWLTATLGGAGAFLALVGWVQAGYRGSVTSFVLRGTSALGALLAVFALFIMWTDRPVTLYGENWGENQGALLTIAQLQNELGCIDTPMDPAASDQGFWQLAVEQFTVTVQCRISPSEDALPVVFVKAESASRLEEIFASGVITANSSKVNDLWVQRDGVVAVITADEVSEELSQEVGAAWISLQDEPHTED